MPLYMARQRDKNAAEGFAEGFGMATWMLRLLQLAAEEANLDHEAIHELQQANQIEAYLHRGQAL